MEAVKQDTQRLGASNEKIPARMREFFWDAPFERLTWDCHRDFIVGRLLRDGSWESIQWLRRKMSDGEIKEWISHRAGAGLTPRQIHFWQLVLGFPSRRVRAWLQSEGRKVWDERVAR